MVMGKVFTGAERGAKRLSAMSSSLGMLGTQGIVAGGAMTAFFGKALKDANDASKGIMIMNAGFKNLGETVGGAAAESGKKFAEAYQFKIGVSAEEIEAAETKFAIFPHMFDEGARHAQIFERATKTAFNMKALGVGDDAATNAMKLGRLLNDPLSNMNALSKILGKMNPQQKEHIKNLYAHNKVAEAQGYVLGLLEKRFKNVAESSASGGAKMATSLHAISVEIGQKLQPSYRQLLSTINGYLPQVLSFVKSHQGLIVAVAKAAVGLLLFSSGMKVLSFGLSGIATTAKIAKGAIGLFGGDIVNGGKNAGLAIKGFDAFRFGLFKLQYAMKFTVIPALQKMGAAFVRFGISLLTNPITIYIAAAVALGAVVYYIIKNWDGISAFFSRLWQRVKNIFVSFWNWAKTMFLNYTPYGLIIKHWDRISGMFGKVWDNVKKVFTGAWQWIKGLGKLFFDAGRNIVTSIWEGMKAMANKPVEAIKKIVGNIRRFLPFSPAKEGPLKDIHRIKLVETIAQSITAKPLLNAWGDVTSKLYGQMNRPVAAYSGGGSTTQIHFSPTINLNGGATEADGNMITAKLKEEFIKLMRDYNRNNERIKF
jgi:hypothetical protein